MMLNNIKLFITLQTKKQRSFFAFLCLLLSLLCSHNIFASDPQWNFPSASLPGLEFGLDFFDIKSAPIFQTRVNISNTNDSLGANIAPLVLTSPLYPLVPVVNLDYLYEDQYIATLLQLRIQEEEDAGI